MSTPQHIRDRVAADAAALAPRVESHAAFIASPAFNDLDAIERILLTQQLEAMRNHHFALRARLHHWGQIESRT